MSGLLIFSKISEIILKRVAKITYLSEYQENWLKIYLQPIDHQCIVFGFLQKLQK